MRLTHSVTVFPQDGTATIYAEISDDPTDTHPILIRYNQEDGATVCLSHDTFAAVTDLVWAHRSDSAVKDTEVVGDHCPARTPRSDYGCILKAGHLPVLGGQWTHINRDALKWNDEPHTHDWEDSGPDTPPGGELCKQCGATRIVR